MRKRFLYTRLKDHLKHFKCSGIDKIEFDLGISMETQFYNNEPFIHLCNDIKKTFFNNNRIIRDCEGNKFYLDKFKILLCDSVNHHNLYYKYASEYMIKNKLQFEEHIPESIKERFKEESWWNAKKNGQDWFCRNLDAINTLLLDNRRFTRDFKINEKDSTILFPGDDKTPTIELLSHDYYYHHKDYIETRKALRHICDLHNNPIEKAFNYEVEYFIRRLKNRGIEIDFEDFRKKQGYNYLFDESVSYIIKHRDQNNLIEFYFGGNEPQNTSMFRHKKVQENPDFKQYVTGFLDGADRRKFVSIKWVEQE